MLLNRNGRLEKRPIFSESIRFRKGVLPHRAERPPLPDQLRHVLVHDAAARWIGSPRVMTNLGQLFYRDSFSDLRDLQAKLSDYVHWYNNFRIHSTLGYMSPVEFRKAGLILSKPSK